MGQGQPTLSFARGLVGEGPSGLSNERQEAVLSDTAFLVPAHRGEYTKRRP